MDATELFENKIDEIIDQATDGIIRARLCHYGNSGDQTQTRDQLKTLCSLIEECLGQKRTSPMLKYAGKMAERRFYSGFGLREIQTVFNILEQSILSEMQPKEYAAAVELISTVIRVGKEAVTRTYLAHLNGTKIPAADLIQFFEPPVARACEPPHTVSKDRGRKGSYK